MRLNRVYIDHSLSAGMQLDLPADAVRHLLTVLKMQKGESIQLFNGDGHNYRADIIELGKKQLRVQIESVTPSENESPLHIHLAQGISRGDKMDLTLQKAVELGVQQITPLFTERCGVKLNSERLQKKMEHWQKVIISACEQSGRCVIPKLNQPKQLNQLVGSLANKSCCLFLDPHRGVSIKSLSAQSEFTVLIGPEGGFSDSETVFAKDSQCQSVQLGKRILRTETAGLTVVSLLQGMFGDF